jgi:hypothetical protein
MGLDMYLYKKTYVKNWDHAPERQHKVSVKLNGKNHPGIDPSKVSYIQEEVGYWRKANHIHQWFVDNCQNGVDECQESYVDIEKIKELLETCIKVRDAKNLEETAKELLPTQSGFFFGGTEYDEYYMQNIKDTIEILKTELKNFEKLEKLNFPFLISKYYYCSSW